MGFEWYKKEDEYVMNECKVVNGRSRYWNEDSGKWVGNKIKYDIVEKYIRYEFSVYDDREILRDFDYSLVDRVGKFLFLIYKKCVEIKRRNKDKWVFIDSKEIESLLGVNVYKERLKKLVKKGIVERKFGKISSYGKDVYLYRLNEDFFSDECYRRVVFIRNSKVIRYLDNRFEKIVNNDDFIKYEIDCCKSLFVDVDDKGLKRLVERRLSKKIEIDLEKKEYGFISKRKLKSIDREWNDNRVDEYKRDFYRSCEILKSEILSVKENGVDYGMWKRDDFSGRLKNIVNVKEREFRKVLKFDVWNVKEVDMVNGYVGLLYRLFRGIRDLKKGYGRFDDRIKEVVGDCDGNDFLEMFEDCFVGNGNERFDYYEYVGLNRLKNIEYSKYKRGYMKELVLYILNGKRDFSKDLRFIDGKYDYDEIGRLLFGKRGFECIEKIKNSDLKFKEGKKFYGFKRYLNMSKILMSIEVMFMEGKFRKLMNEGIRYLNIYDGLIVSSVDVNRVLEIMNENVNDDSLDSSIRFIVK